MPSSSSASQPCTLSSSVAAVEKELSSYPEVSAVQIVNHILTSHAEYAQGRDGRRKGVHVVEDPSTPERRPFAAWIEAVCSRYDQGKGAVLHGRLVILGLCILERGLAEALMENDFLKNLEKEVSPPLTTLLTPSAKREWTALLSYLDHASETSSVPTHLDHPSNVDALGRMAFAGVLAEIICTLHARESHVGGEDPGPFIIHLHGPWGSGKSTLFKFLSSELKRQPPGWVVVNFNAWEHQRLGDPWWWLMDAVFQQSARRLWEIHPLRSVMLRVMEHAWRSMRAGWLPYVVVAIFMLLLAFWILQQNSFFGLFPGSVGKTSGGQSPLQALADTAKAISAIIVLIAGVWGLGVGVSRWLLQKTTHVASTFMESTHDPMGAFTRHFSKMVCCIKHPVAVFIDDLDRCQSTYVVQLLEGLQTLFGETLVTYVVAADESWIHTSFEKVYASFTETRETSERSLGYHFLEKIFDVSTWVPSMLPAFQATYWQGLIGIHSSQDAEVQSKLREEAKQELRKQLEGGKDIFAVVQLASKEGDSTRGRYIREAAAKRLVTPVELARTEHALKNCAPLLESNPRAMKRLVNAYSMEMAIAMLAGLDIDMQQLALWTIIVLRWPHLAKYLMSHPEEIEHIDDPLPDNTPQDVKDLLEDQGEAVRDVIKGKGVDASLDADVIRACASLHQKSK